MIQLKVGNGFGTLSDAALEARAASIATAMDGNAAFPTPTPTLTELRAAIDTFSDALAKAEAGSRYDKAVKNQKRSELITLLHRLGTYVLYTANGNELVAQSSGFSIAKAHTTAPPVTAATNQMLEDGPNTGELKYSFDRVPGARSYMYQYTQEPLSENSVWQNKPGTMRKTVLTGLQSGKRYWCRVLAIGSWGQGVYSNPVSRIVQ